MSRWSDRRRGRVSRAQQAQIWLMLRAMPTLALWLSRREERVDLATLDDHQLRDIGITRDQAQAEAAKPFWR